MDSYLTHPHPPPPSLLPLEAMPLWDLMKNPSVANLYNENNRLIKKVDSLHDQISDLQSKLFHEIKEQNVNLRKETNQLRELKADQIPALNTPTSQNSSLAPSNSISQAAHSTCTHSSLGTTLEPELMDPPPIRPSQYPPQVLWNHEDAVADVAVSVTKSNKSRPSMSRALHNEDGTMAVVQDVLHPLVPKAMALGHTRPFGKTYFKKHWPKEWDSALARIEKREPVLQLCSLHWKAEHIISLILSPPDTTESDISMQPPDIPQKHKSNPPSPQRKRKKAVKDTGVSGITDSNLAVAAIPTPQASVVSAVPSIMLITSSALNLGMTGTLDLSGIEVTAEYKALHSLFTTDLIFNSIPHSINLLERLHVHSQCAEANAQIPQPSPAMQEFLTRIKMADPNDPDIDEDDTDSSWGHMQFRNGSTRFDNIIWEEVANSQTAYEIIAATAKNCIVARHLCFKRNLKPATYLADMYLSTIIGSLWEHWKPMQVIQAPPSTVSSSQAPPSPMLSQAPAPPLSPPCAPTVLNATQTIPVGIDQTAGETSTSEMVDLRQTLQAIHATELRTWAREHSLVIPTSKKIPTKQECVNAMIAASRFPTVEDLQKIIKSRKVKR